MFFIKLTPRENTKVLNYSVIIESITLMCFKKVNVTPKSDPPSIILIHQRTDPKLIPSRWASLNYEFENDILRGHASHHFLQLVNL